MNRQHSLLAVTPGEPSGIGPEILLKLALARPDLPLLAVADADLLRRYASRLKLDIGVFEWQPEADLSGSGLACYPVTLGQIEEPGKLDPSNAAYVLKTLDTATDLVQAGLAGALVTGPVNKAIINEAGIPFTGHTEYLAARANGAKVVMLLAAPGLRVALVTTHLPLRQVADAITTENVESCIRITATDLRSKFGIDKPQLQVLGLNPHAGEDGHLGSEDDELIRPAIERCRADGIDAIGPIPADTAFHPPRLARCDAVIAMYHDQGLPVLKHAGFGQSVNITLGLPFIRTSVDHGTALDIAGQGVADPGSLEQACQMAAVMIKQSGILHS